MTVSVHVTSGTPVEELSHDAQVLRSVLGRLRSAEFLDVEAFHSLMRYGVILREKERDAN